MDELPFFRHGSKDSKDKDIVYIFPKEPSNKECVQFSEKFQDQDINIITLKNNFVTFSFKGSPDESNNSLLATVTNFDQKFKLPIEKKVPRVVPLKVCNTILSVLIIIRKHELYRDVTIEALSSFDFEKRRKFLYSVDFSKIMLSIEEMKFLAFRLGQTISLIQGKELYSKGEIMEMFKDLSTILKREENDSNSLVLNQFLKIFLKEIEGVKIQRKGALHIFWCELEIKNFYHSQCRGCVIDLKLEKLVYFPLTFEFKDPDWPKDSITDKNKYLYVFHHENSYYQFKEGEMFQKTTKFLKLKYDDYYFIMKDKETVIYKRDNSSLEITRNK